MEGSSTPTIAFIFVFARRTKFYLVSGMDHLANNTNNSPSASLAALQTPPYSLLPVPVLVLSRLVAPVQELQGPTTVLENSREWAALAAFGWVPRAVLPRAVQRLRHHSARPGTYWARSLEWMKEGRMYWELGRSKHSQIE